MSSFKIGNLYKAAQHEAHWVGAYDCQSRYNREPLWLCQQVTLSSISIFAVHKS